MEDAPQNVSVTRRIVDAVKNHLAARVGVSEKEMENASKIRDFAKWWFDLIKNAVLVVALKVFADKAHVWYVTALYWVTYLLLIAYIFTYIQGRYYFPFHNENKGQISVMTVMITSTVIAVVVTMLISFFTAFIVTAISEVQMH
jgi:hypothetical protein